MVSNIRLPSETWSHIANFADLGTKKALRSSSNLQKSATEEHLSARIKNRTQLSQALRSAFVQNAPELDLSAAGVRDEDIVGYLQSGPKHHELVLRNNPISNRTIHALHNLPDLKQLDVSKTPVDADSFRALPSQLKSLRANDTIFRSNDVFHLFHIEALNELQVGGTAIDQNTIILLKERFPQLKSLTISHNACMDDFTMPAVGEFHQLEALDISHISATAEGIDDAINPETLKKLSVAGNSQIDEGTLYSLAGSQKLEALDVSHCDLSAEVIRDLSNMPNLTSVNLRGNYEATDDAIAGLLAKDHLEHINLLSTSISTAVAEALTEQNPLKSAHFSQLDNIDKVVSNLHRKGMVEELTLKSNFQSTSLDSFSKLASLPGLRKLTLDTRFNLLTDQQATEISRSASLEDISVNGEELTDDGFKALASLPKLSRLSVAFASLSPQTIAHLAKSPSLENLCLATPVSEIGTAELTAIASLPHLKALQITINVNNNDEGMAALAHRATKLNTLDLIASSALTQQTMQHLANMSSLEHLNLTGCTLNEEDLMELRHSTSLKSLNLTDVEFSRTTAQALATIPTLTTLHTYIDDTDEEALRAFIGSGVKFIHIDTDGVNPTLLQDLHQAGISLIPRRGLSSY